MIDYSMRKIRVLWIEDGALTDLPEFAGPMYTDGRFDLKIALNASAGVEAALEQRFDFMVVDIRLPPGDHDEWIRAYHDAGDDKAEARLGLEILYSLAAHPSGKVYLGPKLEWFDPRKVAILSVEQFHEVEQRCSEVGVLHYHEKVSSTPDDILVRLAVRALGLEEQ